MRKLIIPKLELKELYLNQGLTTYQIADKFNCCQATIWKRINRFGIKARYPWNAVVLPKQELKKLYLKQKLSTWQIEKNYGYCRGTVYRKLIEFSIPTRNIAKSHIIFPRQNFSGNPIEKSYLIGFAMGDLNITKRGSQSETIMVKCGTTQKAQAVLFRKLFGQYGKNWEGKITKTERINIQAGLNPTFSFLLKKRKLADEWIIENKKYFFAFLAGFSDAEGSFYIDNRNRAHYSLGNYNIELLRQIKIMMAKYGIETPKIYVHYRKGIQNLNRYVWNGNYYIPHCSKKKYLLKLLDSLRPHIKHSQKIKDIEKTHENIMNRNKLFGNVNMA